MDHATRARLAWMAILGFACNQGFVYALFYLEESQSLVVGSFVFERADLFGTLLFMCLTFYAVAALAPQLRAIALAPRFAVAYASLLVLGAGVPAFVGQQDAISIIYESICVGIPAALMLCAWGRVLGRLSIDHSVPIVVLGVGLGAAICFVFSAIPVEGVYAVLYFAPLGSSLLLRRVVDAFESEPGLAVPSASADVKDAESLSVKILVGTAVFGLATGLTEVVATDAAEGSIYSVSVTLLLFVLFCVAMLQISDGRPWLLARPLRKSLAVNANSSLGDEGPLGSAYRLAMLLMMSGFLLTPVLGGFGIQGSAIVLVGYLGITVVLIALFLVMAHVSSRDAALSFAQGFGVLFAGELAGILLGNVLAGSIFGSENPLLLTAIAGIAALYAYLFLFTERDMKSLSLVVEEVDQFDAAVRKICEDAALSKREAEILPLALRGRTGERIAAELFISKNTVDTHMRRIYAKCGVHSKQELIDLGERTEKELRGRSA